MTKKVESNSIAAYIRVSTTGQNEAGQRMEVERWLSGRGVQPEKVRWYLDKETGDTLERSGFEQLNRDLFDGKIGTVIVWKLDRLSRSLKDGLNVLSDWFQQGIRFVSVTQQMDFSGPTGKIIAAVLLGIAEMEQETRRERQRSGIEVAKSRGVYKGRTKGTFKSKPLRAKQLRENGLTNSEIANSLGVSRMTVQRYLNQVQ
jgi:DNA invertase Pin-like site-specific DNA recombinase